jgi:hypothetical protein
MSTTLVSLQEYLDTDYSPDREYVDGVVVERSVGEREKLEEYTAMGVAHVWVVDPRAHQAFTYDGFALHRVGGPSLTAGDISIPLDEVFFRL